jgi:hypothetical protein
MESGGGQPPPPPPPDSLGELLQLARDIHRQQRVQVYIPERVEHHRMDEDDDEELVPASGGGGGPPPPPPGFEVVQPLVSELLRTHQRTLAYMEAQHQETQQLRNAAMQYEHNRAAEAVVRRAEDAERHNQTVAMFAEALRGRDAAHQQGNGAAHQFVNRLAGSIAAAVPGVAPIAAPTPARETLELALVEPNAQEKRGSEGASEQPTKKQIHGVLANPAEVAAADSRRRTAELAASAAAARATPEPDATIFASYEPAKRLAPEKTLPYSRASGTAEVATKAVKRVVEAVARPAKPDAPKRQAAEARAMSSQDRRPSTASSVPYEDVVEMQATIAADQSGRQQVAPRVRVPKKGFAPSRGMGQRFEKAIAARIALNKFAEKRGAVVGGVMLPVARKTLARSGITKGTRGSRRAVAVA